MNYPSIRIEGAILSADILEKLDDAVGQRPADFGFEPTVKVKDEIARAWADAQEYWRIYQRRLEGLKTDSPATTETRNLWIVPLLGLLGYNLEFHPKSIELNGKLYPISHRVTNRGNAALHILGSREPAGLDRKPEKAALRMSAHAMMQEYLNLNEQLYGIVTNGRLLRLLRDSSRLVKLTYLEFDLDRIFTDGLFADFAVLYRLLHVSRLPASHEASAESLIERYHQDSVDSGARIRDGLSRAVETAIRSFANGFLSHPNNTELREVVTSGRLAAGDYYQHLLRLIYRLLFLMVIEERNLIYPLGADSAKRRIYEEYYSVQRLRRLSEKRFLADRRHNDHWLSLLTTFRLFEDGGPGGKLGIAPLAGDLFSPRAIGPLQPCSLDNETLLGCLRALGLYENATGQLVRVNYGALNVEEFGSVYEGLLEYEPVFLTADSQVEFDFAKGDQRAATGSHYTPDDLVQPLIKHSLDYLIAEKLASSEQRAASGNIEELTEEEKLGVYQILSGSRSLAAGDDSGGNGIHSDKAIPQGGVVRHGISDSPGGIVHSSKYSGGMGAGIDQGVSTLSAHSTGQPAGTGNPSSVVAAGQSGLSGNYNSPLGNLSGSRSSNHSPATPPYSEARFLSLWASTPLTARRSLLTEKALLSLRVADISCGSGHILLAAARRIATELAIVRTGEEQPSPSAFRAAVRDVIRHCIYGVDLNPLAVELCKVALWLEAHIPGQPLNFLDHHIKCGNAIVGFARREELEKGVPDEAFATMPGDDKETVAFYRKRNKGERKQHEIGQLPLSPQLQKQLDEILQRWGEISRLPERNPTEIEAKKSRYQEFAGGPGALLMSQIAAIPIAQFYIGKTPENSGRLITDEEYRRYLAGQRTPQGQATATAWDLGLRKRFFHWFLEFPEVIEQGGFDCILGNPPYLGGQALSGTYGHSLCNYVKWEYAPAGLSDLVAYFVRRIYSILRPGGFTAFITTNSIKDGDIRKDGLEQVLAQGGTINMAVRGIKWPGRANLVVALVALHRGEWLGRKVLDGKDVPVINAFFEDSEDSGEPNNLLENANSVYQGSIFLGDGFLLPHEEADSLVESDPRNRDVICKVINGDELNNQPDQDPQRSVINFQNCAESQASRYPLPFAIIEQRVKPARLAQKDKGGREYWWRFLRPRNELYAAIQKNSRCFVAAATTKYLNFSAAPTSYVFLNTLYVFTTDRWDLYTIVQSTIHEVWARKYSGALKQDLRYSPSKCFDTFPFPQGLWQTANPTLADTGERYHEYRRALMLRLWLGLTDIYNLFHNRDLTPAIVAKVSKKPDEAKTGYQGILELRKLHRELDQAVLTAYGWGTASSEWRAASGEIQNPLTAHSSPLAARLKPRFLRSRNPPRK